MTTRLTRRISLNVPILSSPIDTVTESAMAIALAQWGGWDHSQDMSVERQTEEVEKCQAERQRHIANPATLPPEATVGRAQEIMQQYNVSGVPITHPDGRLVGIITRRDLRFLRNRD